MIQDQEKQLILTFDNLDHQIFVNLTYLNSNLNLNSCRFN